MPQKYNAILSAHYTVYRGLIIHNGNDKRSFKPCPSPISYQNHRTLNCYKFNFFRNFAPPRTFLLGNNS